MVKNSACRLVIEAVDTPVFGGAVWINAWRLMDDRGNLILGGGSSPHEALPGHHVKAMYPAILECLERVETSIHIHIVSRADHVVKEMQRTAAERSATYYRRANKKPLADEAMLRQIDGLVEAKHLTISASRPETSQDHEVSTELQWHLQLSKEDVGKAPGWRY